MRTRLSSSGLVPALWQHYMSSKLSLHLFMILLPSGSAQWETMAFLGYGPQPF